METGLRPLWGQPERSEVLFMTGELIRARVLWAGVSGGQGVSTLYVKRDDAATPVAGDVGDALTRLRLFFENTSEWLPNDVTVSFPTSVDLIDPGTGSLTQTLTSSTSPANITGALTTAWANGVGSRVIWETGTVFQGRRFRGSTYLVPYGGVFDTDGTLSSTATSDLLTNATALLTNLATDGLELHVWSPKFLQSRKVTSARVTDKAVVLRSRRD
jgi:hypothetical protein